MTPQHPEHGVLFSHASESVADDLVAGGHASAAAALEHGERIAEAMPGIEFEVMYRDSPAGDWLSDAGLPARAVIASRWHA